MAPEAQGFKDSHRGEGYGAEQPASLSTPHYAQGF